MRSTGALQSTARSGATTASLAATELARCRQLLSKVPCG